MPEISRFFGIVIVMIYGDHDPPHFHVRYSGYEAKIEIESGEIVKGELPRRALRLIQDWIELHKKELLDNFAEIKNNSNAWKEIEPLQ